MGISAVRRIFFFSNDMSTAESVHHSSRVGSCNGKFPTFKSALESPAFLSLVPESDGMFLILTKRSGMSQTDGVKHP